MLTDEMKEAIEKNLPAQIGSVLQERLAEVESVQTMLTDVTEELALAKETIVDWQNTEKALDRRESKLSSAESLHQANVASLEQRSIELGEEEHRVAMADLKADMHSIQSQEMRSIISEVFHSPMYRKTVTASGSHDVITPDPNGGGYPQTHTAHHNDTTTTEVDES